MSTRVVDVPVEADRQLIEERNALDIRLYEQVRLIHAAEWERAGGSAAMQLRLFRLLNRLYALRTARNRLLGLGRAAGRRARSLTGGP